MSVPDYRKLVIVFFDDERLVMLEEDRKKEFLRDLFENERLTNGGPIETIQLHGKQAFIYFKDVATVDHVMRIDNGIKNKKITVNGYKFTLKRSNAVKIEENEAVTTVKGEKMNNIGAASSGYQYRRPVIIDGNNVAISHGRQRLFSCRGLEIAIDYFTKLGHTDVKAIVPKFRRSTKDSDMPTMNPELLDTLYQRDQLLLTPNKVYDDDIILKAAIEKNAVVVSNDRFRDFNVPAIKSYLKENLIEYTWDGDNFIVADMPFGRGKPSLEEIMTRRLSSVQQAPANHGATRRSESVGRTRNQIPKEPRTNDAFSVPHYAKNQSATPQQTDKVKYQVAGANKYERRRSNSRSRLNSSSAILPLGSASSGGFINNSLAVNQARIGNFFFYDHLREKRREIEKEYQVRLKFTGVGDAESPDSDDSGDDSDKSSTASGPSRPSKKKFYCVLIEGYWHRVAECKGYLEVLSENLRIKRLSIPHGDWRDVHGESLLRRKIEEIKEGENLADSSDEDQSTEIGLRKNKKTRKFYLLVSSTSKREVSRIMKLLRELKVIKKEIQAKKKSLDVLMTKHDGIQQEFNVKLYLDFKGLKVDLFYLNTDIVEVAKVEEMIKDLEEESKMKTVTVWPSREKQLVANCFRSQYLKTIRDEFAKNGSINEDKRGRGFYTLKSTSQVHLDEAVKKCQTAFNQIEADLVYSYVELAPAVHQCILKHKGLEFSLKKTNVVLKGSRQPVLPSVCLTHKRGHMKLYISKGNIVDANTSTIVNSVNAELAHGAGVARAIAEAAGEEYANECERLPKPLDKSRVHVTTSGRICVQSIINVVCPVFSLGSQLAALSAQYKLCLDKACELKYQSIALPLLGAGVYNWPVETSFQALLDSASKIPVDASLQEIVFVESDQGTFNEIASLVQRGQLGQFAVDFDLNPTIKLPNEKKWYWIDDSGQWKEYRASIARQINQHRPLRRFQLDIDGQSYSFDLDRLVQVNAKTGYKRKIQDDIPLQVSAQWYCQINGEQAYGVSDNQKIETAFKAGHQSLDLLIMRHVDDINCMYRLDFAKMIQINLNTSYERRLTRKEVQIPATIVKEKETIPDSDSDPSVDLLEKLENHNYKLKLWLVGKLTNVAGGKKEIEKTVESLKGSATIESQSVSDLQETELTQKGFKKKSTTEWTKSGVSLVQKGSDIHLSGPLRKDVEQVKEQLYRLLLNKMKIEYPETWTPTASSNSQFELCPLSKSGQEWNGIESEFKKTLPQGQIISIERVQNKSIYRDYFGEKNYLMKKNNASSAKETFLWHGTRTVDPTVIYSSDKCGFDFHHSNEGLWGRGIYFAVNASYSNNYAFNKPDKSCKQFLYCSVLLGESTPNLPSNRDLRGPPIKSDKNERYDSVLGNTNGSDVYIVYENQKAYPAYLVSFK